MSFLRARKRRAKRLVSQMSTGSQTADLCTDYFDFRVPVGAGTIENPTCYAKAFRKCTQDISREHYIPRSILTQFDYIEAEGIPWIQKPGLKLTEESLQTKCLCSAHNNNLATLDALAGRCFTEILNVLTTDKHSVVIAGHTFERCLLKILFGLLGTGRIEHGGIHYDPAAIAADWLHPLFGYETFPAETGLYVYLPVGQKLEFKKTFYAAPLFLENRIGGLRVSLCGIEFTLSLVPKSVAFRTDHAHFDQILFRPNKFERNSQHSVIQFVWE